MRRTCQTKRETNNTGEDHARMMHDVMTQMLMIDDYFLHRYSDLESRMKDELMNVKIKFTEQSARLAELKQEVSRLETKV